MLEHLSILSTAEFTGYSTAISAGESIYVLMLRLNFTPSWFDKSIFHMAIGFLVVDK